MGDNCCSCRCMLCGESGCGGGDDGGDGGGCSGMVLLSSDCSGDVYFAKVEFVIVVGVL